MKDKVKHYVIIGSSRGLGAALVEELLKDEFPQIIGVARTNPEKIQNYKKWTASGRYRHAELDVASSEGGESLKSICSELPRHEICVIFNAAILKSDVHKDGRINHEVFEEVNRVGINGLENVINAFENHLLAYGGVLVGISSFSALAPPVFDPRVAYPATKAYLDMTLRCLRIIWRKKVKVLTVHLGHMGNFDNFFSRRIVPTYSVTARKIIRSISGRKIPREINYPLLYTITYKYILPFIPDIVYVWLFHSFLKLGNFLKGSKE